MAETVEVLNTDGVVLDWDASDTYFPGMKIQYEDESGGILETEVLMVIPIANGRSELHFKDTLRIPWVITSRP